MSKIRILSKKAFALGPGASRNAATIDQFITVRGAIQEIDEKYTQDLTFKMAVKAGDIIVMNDNISVKSPKIVDVEPVKAADPVEEYKQKIKAMSAEEVEQACEEYGAEYDKNDKLRENKKRLLEAYKLKINE